MYYKYDKVNPNCGRSYTDSPDWIKRATINPINKKDNKCFQCVIIVALNYEKIKKYPQRITKIKPFINKYKLEGLNVQSKKDDWKKI